MSRPAVTVLMPVYNEARYLPEALESILSQSFRDFELLVINDGSTDGSREILQACTDPRLRIVDTPNRGVSASLRLGMRLARAPYVARMDADDVAMPRRLEVQKIILDAFPDVVVTHSRADRIDTNGCVVDRAYGVLLDDIGTKWALLWHNAIFHSTVMLRKDVLRHAQINYRRETLIAQDFEIWNRIAMIGDFHMSKDVLMQYRIHDAQISRPENAARQLDVVADLIRENLARYGVDVELAVSREIMVATGGTHFDMSDWPYSHIPGELPSIVSRLEHSFTAHHRVTTEVLHIEQARLFLQWARSLAPNYPGAGLGLLARALVCKPGLLLRKRCWVILAFTVIPRSWISRFEKGSAGLPSQDIFNG